MRQRELLFLSVGVFLTMIAIVVNTIYQVNSGPSINREIQQVDIPNIHIDHEVFSNLKNRPL